MAVTPTGAIYKALFFDGESSRNYGVYITGEAVYNSPERDVEMIKIPGRNGEFALDNGRFENIEVTYPAGIFADNEADFAEAISDFRNFLASRVGYCRLEDEYNPNEYRMAVYKSGLNVDPAKLEAGEFSITFDCKPQRWLKDGETAVTMASGDTLTNPTLFESSPLLETAGSGTIAFNDYEIEFEGVPIGEVVIGEHGASSSSGSGSDNPYTETVTLDTTLLNIGDAIYPEVKDCSIGAIMGTDNANRKYTALSVASTNNVLDANISWHASKKNQATFRLYPDFGEGFAYGTAKTITCSAVFNYGIDTSTATNTETIQVSIAYGGADTYTVTVTRSGTLATHAIRALTSVVPPTMYGDSSKPNDDPIFIDCDLGEAYTNEGGVYRSLNQYIDLGSELPTLGVGVNEVTFDNTITELKITPRWWKV